MHIFVPKHSETALVKSFLDYHKVVNPFNLKPYSEEMLLGLGGGLCFEYNITTSIPTKENPYRSIKFNPILRSNYNKNNYNFIESIFESIGVDAAVKSKNKIFFNECSDCENPKQVSFSIKHNIKQCAYEMLNSGNKNNGLSGIEKWIKALRGESNGTSWINLFKTTDELAGAILNTYQSIEIDNNGGGAFRKMYAAFLTESSSIFKQTSLGEISNELIKSGNLWSKFAEVSLSKFKNSMNLKDLKKNIADDKYRTEIQKDLRLKDSEKMELFNSMADILVEIYRIESEIFSRLNCV